MDVRRRVGLNVKAARQDLGLSQEALAFECRLHRTYVSGVERGIRNPTVTVLEKIAIALKVPAARLLDELPGGSAPVGRGRRSSG
jgi:transcriptional regulator with XRE-family HTH domain